MKRREFLATAAFATASGRAPVLEEVVIETDDVDRTVTELLCKLAKLCPHKVRLGALSYPERRRLRMAARVSSALPIYVAVRG